MPDANVKLCQSSRTQKSYFGCAQALAEWTRKKQNFEKYDDSGFWSAKRLYLALVAAD